MEAVAVALVAAVPPTVMAFAAWRKGNETKNAVGTPNGRGSLHDMVDFLCHRVERLEGRIDRMEDRTFGDGR